MKYNPQTKSELEALVRDERVYLGEIDTSAITDMSRLFCNIKLEIKRKDFSGIASWDTSNVRDMSSMFVFCREFNEPIGCWDVRKVVKMDYMFDYCKSFTQSLDSWQLTSLESAECILPESYSAAIPTDLEKWRKKARRSYNLSEKRFLTFGCGIKLHNLLKDIIKYKNDEIKIKSALKVIENECFDDFTSHAEVIVTILYHNAPLALKLAFEIDKLYKAFLDEALIPRESDFCNPITPSYKKLGLYLNNIKD